MAARFRPFRPVAIALVVEDDDGNLMLYGSKRLSRSEVEMTVDAGEAGPFLSSRYIPPRRSFRIEAECHDLIVQYTQPAPLPPQIEQRGIYLPDMSFRALPAPADYDKSTDRERL